MENMKLIERKFKDIGARIKFIPNNGNNRIPVNFDISKDKKGEFFSIGINKEKKFDLSVLDIQKAEKHLLLMLKVKNGEIPESFKILCGYDERHWFTCGVPERSIRNVFDAMEALKPESIIEAQDKIKLKGKTKNKRKNVAFIRQGEWFFRPVDINPPENSIYKNEPISRGGMSSPHMVEMIYREGGETVYFHKHFAPSGFTDVELKDFLQKNPNVSQNAFQMRARDAKVYAKGKVRHRDHKTIILPSWYEVFMNRETESRIAPNIVFLD